MAAQGVGGVTATVLIASLGFVIKKGKLALIVLVVGSAAILMVAQSHWLPLSLAMLAFLGLSQTTFIVTNQVLMQSMIPDALRGRVTSIYMLEFSLGPLAILFIGLLMDVYSVSGALTIVASISLTAALFLLLIFRRVRNLG
jgi:MFS family permease